MKVAEQIRNKINGIPESQPFGYADLGIGATDFYTAAKVLERLQKKRCYKKGIERCVLYSTQNHIWGIRT
jgi:hypothetical protein